MDSALPHIPAYLSHLSPGTLLPTAWNTKEKFNHIEVSQQNLQAAYKGKPPKRPGTRYAAAGWPRTS